MRYFIIYILLFVCNSLFAQELNQIKHIEIVSEIQDSMALLNKTDIEKINKTFYEKRKSDSLNVINDSIISHLSKINMKLDSVALNQLKIIQNDEIIITRLQSETGNLQKKLKKAHNTIAIETTAGIIVIAILCLLI